MATFAAIVEKHMTEALKLSDSSDMSEDEHDRANLKRARDPKKDEVDEDEDSDDSDSDSSTAPPGSDDDVDEDDSDDDEEAVAPERPTKPTTLSIVVRKALDVKKSFEKHKNLRKAAIGWTHDDEVSKKAWDKVISKIGEVFDNLRQSRNDIEFRQLIKWTLKSSLESPPYMEALNPGDGEHLCVISGGSATHLFTMIANPRIRYLDLKLEKPSYQEWYDKNPNPLTYTVAVRDDCVPYLVGMLQFASFNDMLYKGYTTHEEAQLHATFEATMDLCMTLV